MCEFRRISAGYSYHFRTVVYDLHTLLFDLRTFLCGCVFCGVRAVLCDVRSDLRDAHTSARDVRTFLFGFCTVARDAHAIVCVIARTWLCDLSYACVCDVRTFV